MQDTLKTQVKAGQITNLTDARYFAARGASWLGFQLDAGGAGQVSPQMFSAIKEWVEGPLFVGTFGASTAAEINETVNLLNLDMIQVGLFSGLDDLKQIKTIPVIKEIVVQEPSDLTHLEQELEAYNTFVDSFLLDFGKNGINWEMLEAQPEILALLSKFCKNFRIILSIVSKPEQTIEIIDKLNPLGFNFVGGDEEKVGFKSFEDLDKIFDLLEIEEE